jgi:glycosyltransferase involved in cell wall biosynthesis
MEVMQRIAQTKVFKIPQHLSTVRLAADHLRSVVARRVFTVYRLTSRDFSDELKSQVLTWSPDLIHLDSLDLSAALPQVPLDRVAVTHHNVESELLERRAEIEANRVRSAYFRFQGELQLAEEQRWCPQVALNVTVSDRDAEELAKRSGGGRYAIAPNGVDVDFFTPGGVRADEQSGVVFVGGTTWFPNRDALEYFADDMLPALNALTDGVEVKWIGRATPEEIAAYADRGIQMTGFVDDIRDHVRQAACFVMPFRVGGGTRLKLLDAWAMGKAVVSTSQGAEGVEAIEGRNILIRDDPSQFVNAVAEVLANKSLREQLGRGARHTAEDVYSWDKIGADLRAAYASV